MAAAAAPIQVMGLLRCDGRCLLAHPFRKSRGSMTMMATPLLGKKTYRNGLDLFDLHRPYPRDLAVQDAGGWSLFQLPGRLRTLGTSDAGSWPASSDKKTASCANPMCDAAPSRYSAGLQIG